MRTSILCVLYFMGGVIYGMKYDLGINFGIVIALLIFFTLFDLILSIRRNRMERKNKGGGKKR